VLVLGLSGGFAAQETGFEPDLSETHFHDACACLIRDGELVAAVEEERFNRVKKTTKFPANAIRACLAEVGVSPTEIDAVGYFATERPTDLLLKYIYMGSPEMPIPVSRDLLNTRLHEALGRDLPNERLLCIPHHICHAMSSFMRCPLSCDPG
jgi:decarbamoylnovobiocin carbamoyltransferase/7-O-carbamoyltransferase